jgi:hypothetical protein
MRLWYESKSSRAGAAQKLDLIVLKPTTFFGGQKRERFQFNICNENDINVAHLLRRQVR